MKPEILERKMNRFYLSEKIKNKYRRINNYLIDVAKLSPQEIEKRVAEMDMVFVAHVAKKKRKNKLILERQRAILNPCGYTIVNISADENIMQLVDVKNTQKMPPTWQIFAYKTVFVPADKDDNPQLTIKDILRQLPLNLLETAKGFSISLEENFAENGYNVLLDAYEYEVHLYK